MVPGDRASHSSAVPIPRPAPSQVEGGWFPRGDPEVPALASPGDLVAVFSPVRACARTQPLALEMGRRFVTKGPSAGPAASVHKDSPLFFLQLALACRRDHQPFDIPAGGPEVGVEAERGRRQCWEEGRAPQALCLLWFWYLPLSLPLPLHFWQCDRPSAQDENSKVSRSHPGRLRHPEPRG